MSTMRLRWEKIVNELRYLYQELKLTQALGGGVATDFQDFYKDFCRRHNVSPEDLQQPRAPEAPEVLRDTPDASCGSQLTPHDAEASDSAQFDKLLEEAEQRQEISETHKAFYKVFKQLAMKLHPDRQGPDTPQEDRETNMKLFKEARRALDEKRYFVLLDLAEQYGIELPTNYKDQIKWMRTEAQTVVAHIEQEKQTYNYIFAECENVGQKEELMKQLLLQLYGYKVE